MVCRWRNEEISYWQDPAAEYEKISCEESREPVGTRVIRNEEKVFVDMTNFGNVAV